MRENKPQPASRWALALLAVLAAPLARALSASLQAHRIP